MPFFAKEDDEHPAGVEVLEEEMDQMDSFKLEFKYQPPNVMGEPMHELLSLEEMKFLYDNVDEEEDKDEHLEIMDSMSMKHAAQEEEEEE